MAGFQRRAWGNKPTTQSQASTSDKWNLTVKSAKYSKNGDIGFKLGGFNYQDLSAINKINPDVFFVKQGAMDKAVWLWIKSGKMDEFMADVAPLESALTSSGHYSNDSIKSFCEKIENYAESVPTEEEISANNEKIATNWKELLSTMTDPEVRKKFLAFQTTYACMTRFKSAALSPNNVISVLAADPQATFVTDKNTWETKFLRRVQPNAPFVIIIKAENSLPPINLLNQDPIVKAAGGWNALVKKSGGPWYGEAHAAIKRVRLNNKLKTAYYKSKEYDVRYTTPINPSKDPFMEIPNLINNLTGEINNAAKAMLDKEARSNGVEPMDYNEKTEGITTSEKLLEFKDFILKKCEKLRINVPEVGSDADVITNAVYTYAYAYAEKLNKLHPKAKEAFANAVCYAIAATFNIQSNKVASCAHFFSNLNPEDVETIAMDSFETYKTLANFSLREDVGAQHVMSFDEYSNLLVGKSRNRKMIKNKFDDMSSRMNAL